MVSTGPIFVLVGNLRLCVLDSDNGTSEYKLFVWLTCVFFSFILKNRTFVIVTNL